MIELNLCPFCGNSPQVKHIGNEYLKKQVCEVACTTMGCFAQQRVGILNGRGHTYEWAEQKCVERWNRRVTTSDKLDPCNDADHDTIEQTWDALRGARG